MKGYCFHIWRPCFYNGEFTHNSLRIETVHAEDEANARKKIALQEETKPSHGYNSGAEFIYKIVYLGFVKETVVFEYVEENPNAAERG